MKTLTIWVCLNSNLYAMGGAKKFAAKRVCLLSRTQLHRLGAICFLIPHFHSSLSWLEIQRFLLAIIDKDQAVVAYTFNSSVLGRQRQRDLCELEANAGYGVCSRTTRATQMKPVLENQEKKKGITSLPHLLLFCQKQLADRLWGRPSPPLCHTQWCDRHI